MTIGNQEVVLVIDDEEVIRDNFRSYLEDYSYQVIEAENGKNGLEIFGRERPDLVLVDLRMPVVDGFEVLRKVVECSPDTPVIVVSGTGVIADTVEALRMGAWDYLMKPLEDLSVLRHSMEKALEQARLVRQNRLYQEHLEEEVARRTADLEKANASLTQSAQALRLSEEKVRTLIETTSDWAWEINVYGIYTFANPRIKDLLGYDVDEILGKSIFDFVAENDLERSRAYFKQGVSMPEPFRCWRNALVHKTGRLIIVEINATPIFGSDGSLTGWYGFDRDITESIHAENALKESEEKFRTFMETASDLMSISDKDGILIYVNLSMARTLGYSKEELIGRHVRELLSEENQIELFASRYAELVSKGKISTETMWKAKDGKKIFGEMKISAIYDSSGAFKGSRGIFRDLTEHKKAVDALRKSEQRFALAMEATNDGIWDLDLVNNNVYYSPRCIELLGVNPDLGTKRAYDIWASCLHPDDSEQAIRAYTDHLKKNTPYNVEYRYRNNDGDYRWHGAWGKAFFDENGKPYRIVGAIRDITEQKRAEEEKNRLQAQLLKSQKLEAIGTLAGGIAHDFNNLLMGIQGRVSLMLMDTDSSHPHFEHLKGLEKHVQSAADLTRQLLGFARGGKYQVKPSNINELIKEQSRMFGRTNKEVTIRSRYEGQIWPVEADKGQIQQVLLNLYLNAAHAMPSGGVLSIQTENMVIDESYIKPFDISPGRYVKISVTDTGVGMDKSTMERIFEPFFTTKAMGRGSGLGLASVYGIVKNHGGFINVYSELNEGTTFNIYLPATDKLVKKEDLPSIQIQKGEGTVLLVDDEDMIIDVGARMIKSFGYKVLTAGDGKEAVELYKSNNEKIDIVILDMIMPGMGGGETFDILRQFDPNVKVLLSSGYSIDGRAQEILDRGCHGFIQKPFDMKGLSNKIVEILAKR